MPVLETMMFQALLVGRKQLLQDRALDRKFMISDDQRSVVTFKLEVQRSSSSLGQHPTRPLYDFIHSILPSAHHLRIDTFISIGTASIQECYRATSSACRLGRDDHNPSVTFGHSVPASNLGIRLPGQISRFHPSSIAWLTHI